jgi:REP-associated tyrosine transposase
VPPYFRRRVVSSLWPHNPPLSYDRSVSKDPPHLKRSPHRLPGFDYTSDDHAYFLTIRAQTGSPFSDPRLAQLVVGTIEWLRANRGIRVYAYCLMPDHVHLLLQLPPRAGSERQPEGGWSPSVTTRDHTPLSLSTVVHSLKSFTTRESWKLGYRGKVWQDRSYDRILRRAEQGQAVAEYILQNPVRKGLVAVAEDYPWSGTPDPL